jgi:hypothetical protein
LVVASGDSTLQYVVTNGAYAQVRLGRRLTTGSVHSGSLVVKASGGYWVGSVYRFG